MELCEMTNGLAVQLFCDIHNHINIDQAEYFM